MANDGTFWWERKADSNMGQFLSSYFEALRKQQGPRLRMDLENLRIYGAPQTSPFLSGGWGYGTVLPKNPYLNASRVVISLAQACIDTLTSKLSQDQPRPTFITEGGSFEGQELAKNLQAFTDGVFYETRAYQKAIRSFVDAGIFGTGVHHGFVTDDGRVGLERVYPYELFVDDLDGIYGEPQNLYRVKYIDRGQLRAMFPEFADEIMVARGFRSEDMATNTAMSNRVQVVEAWHLPSSKTSNDGRRVVVMSNATLVDAKWTRPRFPFSFLRYNPKQVGFWAQGLCEPLAPLQNEMNTLLRKIQICMHFLAVPHWLKPAGSNIQFGSFNNQIGSVINYSGQPPELKVWESVPRECFEHVDWLYNKAFEMAGISQMSATSKVPGYGTMSGYAMRTHADIESDRFQALSRAWAQFHIDIAEMLIDVAEEIAEEKGGYEVTVMERTATGKPAGLRTIKWKEIRLQERKFQIEIQPTSKFATDIPGALQTGQELVQAGLMDADTFKDVMNFPDLKAEQNLDGASRDLVHKIVYNILAKGTYQDPDPYMDLEYAMRYATLRLNQAMLEDVDTDRIEQLRTWISAADDIVQTAKAATAPAPGAGGPMPPGAGGPQGGPPPGAMPGPTPAPPPQPLAPVATPAPIQ